tara:strand:+ start:18634 stop:19515 length:882 start_codon:yes stop_codon:yes gene_type:complete
MKTITLNIDNERLISDFFEFLSDKPNHGFRDFHKYKKFFLEEITKIISDNRYKILISHIDKKIENYFLIKNEDSLNRSIIMTLDVRKISEIIHEIKKITKSNKIEIAIRDSNDINPNEFSFLKLIKIYNFMKLNSSEKIAYTKNNNFKICSVDENKNIEGLVNIQNDCFSDHYGYEINSIKDFREELNSLKHTNIKSFFNISKSISGSWVGYTWTQKNLSNSQSKLSMCGVKKEFRNKGLAKELIIVAINELIKSNCDEIMLEVDQENIPAKKIYEEIGFYTYDKVGWYELLD